MEVTTTKIQVVPHTTTLDLVMDFTTAALRELSPLEVCLTRPATTTTKAPLTHTTRNRQLFLILH